MTFFEIEYLEREKSAAMPDKHQHDSFFELYFLIEGNLQAIFNGTLLDITAPSMLVIPPKDEHRNCSGPGKRYLIYLSPDCLSPFELKCLWKMSEKAYELPLRVISLLEEMLSVEQKDEANFKDKQLMILKYLIYLMLDQTEIHNSMTNLQKSDKQLIIASVINYIERNFNKDVSYDALSKEFSISASYLKKHFKIITGKTIGGYVLQVRIENAKKLLALTNKSIDEIASETGFYNASYFSKCFCRQVGITPLKYRKHKRV